MGWENVITKNKIKQKKVYGLINGDFKFSVVRFKRKRKWTKDKRKETVELISENNDEPN